MQQLRFILRKCFYSTCFGWQSHPSSGVHVLYMATGKLAHFINKFVRSKESYLCGLCGVVGSHCLVVLRRAFHWWVRLSPETCRVKAFAKSKPQLLHHVGIIFTTKAWSTEPQILNVHEVSRSFHVFYISE